MTFASVICKGLISQILVSKLHKYLYTKTIFSFMSRNRLKFPFIPSNKITFGNSNNSTEK